MSEILPSLLQRLQGKDYESAWRNGVFESMSDKHTWCYTILRDISRLAWYVDKEQGFTLDPRTIKRIAKAMRALFMYMYRVYFEYVGWSENDIIPNPVRNHFFQECTEYHKGVQYYTRKIDHSIAEIGNVKKLDKLILRLSRASNFIHKITIGLEYTERNVIGQ